MIKILSMIPAPLGTLLDTRTVYRPEDSTETVTSRDFYDVIGYAVVDHPHPSGQSYTKVEAVFYVYKGVGTGGIYTESQYRKMVVDVTYGLITPNSEN